MFFKENMMLSDFWLKIIFVINWITILNKSFLYKSLKISFVQKITFTLRGSMAWNMKLFGTWRQKKAVKHVVI